MKPATLTMTYQLLSQLSPRFALKWASEADRGEGTPKVSQVIRSRAHLRLTASETHS